MLWRVRWIIRLLSFFDKCLVLVVETDCINAYLVPREAQSIIELSYGNMLF